MNKTVLLIGCFFMGASGVLSMFYGNESYGIAQLSGVQILTWMWAATKEKGE